MRKGRRRVPNAPRGISRRSFLSRAASTAAACCLPVGGAAILTSDTRPLAAQNTTIKVSREAGDIPPIMILNSGYRLLIDPVKGTIASLQSTYGVDRELLIQDHVRLPLFILEFMNDNHEFQLVTSSDAKSVAVRNDATANGRDVKIEYSEIGGLPVHAVVTISCPTNETLTYWKLELKNETKLWIGHVQFPVIEVPFDDPESGERSYILSSSLDGSLAGPVEPASFTRPHWTRHTFEEMDMGDSSNVTTDLWMQNIWSGRQKNTPEIWRSPNYPGQDVSTQLMAYYNSVGGLYLACDDAAGLPKFLDRVMEMDGVTLGLAHYPGVCGPGEYAMPYNVVVGTFHGDWYRAAEIYRNWATKQAFCGSKLADRKDLPPWITDSAVGIAFPMRGQADWDKPSTINPEYTPATNALPYLEKLAAELDSPLMPFVYNWERPGPWVQPDAFPPLGGEAAMREFMAKAKEKGWSPFLYGDGLCWVISQGNTGYDGMSYLKSHGGEAAVCRSWDGTPMGWQWPWRKSYFACVGTEKGREMILEMTRNMAELGPSVIQQFDQDPGPIACYATDHGHPPVPGPWMTEAFAKLLKADAEAAHTVNSSIRMSCEGAPPEVYLQDFQIWDGRVQNCPLFSFLYHEYCNGHDGFFGNRVSDEALSLSVGRAIVTGYMLNFTLREKGLLEYDWDDAWTRAIPDQSAVLDWAKRTNHFRAGIAKDYLVYGRMLRPWTVSNVTSRDFGIGKEPLVQSATWQAADGRIGIVLANCADEGESPRVELRCQGSKTVSLFLDGHSSVRTMQLPGVIDIDMQPRSLCLIELA